MRIALLADLIVKKRKGKPACFFVFGVMEPAQKIAKRL
jgi:hypothetical protein